MPKILSIVLLLMPGGLIGAQPADSPRQALLAQDAAARMGNAEADLDFYQAKGEALTKLAHLIVQADVSLAKLQTAVEKQFGAELASAVGHAASSEDAHDIENASEKVEGDQATVEFKDHSPPVHMVKVDGKWKISLADMVGEATDPQIEKLGRAISQFTSEVQQISELVQKHKFRSGEGVRDRVQDLHDRLFKSDNDQGTEI